MLGGFSGLTLLLGLFYWREEFIDFQVDMTVLHVCQTVCHLVQILLLGVVQMAQFFHHFFLPIDFMHTRGEAHEQGVA